MRTPLAALVLAALLTPASAAEPQAASWWKPTPGLSFAIRLLSPPPIATSPAAVVDTDLFDTPATIVAGLKKQGKKTVCYFSAGSWEDWRSDAARFPAVVKGKAYDGWPGENWLDIRRWDILGPIMVDRMKLCKTKGFDAVDPDNVADVDTWGDVTGFHLKRWDSIVYIRRLAANAHALGLAFGLKNASDLARYPEVMGVADFTVTEDCFAQGWCAESKPFIDAGKPVFALEYTDNRISFTAFCAQAKTLGLSPLLKRRNLDAWEKRCP